MDHPYQVTPADVVLGARATRIVPPGQSCSMSLVETTTNVVVGYALAIATPLVEFPLFGLEAAFGEHLAIGMGFVAVTLARGYVLRRLFERIALRMALVDTVRHEPRGQRDR